MKLIKLVIGTFALFALACGNTTTVNTPPKPSPGASPVATPPPAPDAMAVAKEYFGDTCANCHQENGEGGPVKIEGKKLNVPALTKGHALGHTDEQLAKQIANGGDGMPAFKEKLPPEKISDLVIYIRKTFQSGANPAAAQTRAESLNATPSEGKKSMNMSKD